MSNNINQSNRGGAVNGADRVNNRFSLSQKKGIHSTREFLPLGIRNSNNNSPEEDIFLNNIKGKSSIILPTSQRLNPIDTEAFESVAQSITNRPRGQESREYNKTIQMENYLEMRKHT